MKPGKKTFSVKWKMYIFITITVLVVALGTAAIAFSTSVAQIDSYYKQSASDNARNFASMVDGDYLAKLKEAAASDEFQELRKRAEAEENEELIEEYLKEHDLWEGYYEIRTQITNYLSNMEEIEYIYVIAHGDKDALYDMYLVDDEENPLYETGYYEERETELLGKDLENLEVLLLEVNPYDPKHQDQMETILQNWFSGMGVQKMYVGETDQPSNTRLIIDKFMK